MNRRKLILEIVTPDGPALKEGQVDAVVLRRREKHYVLGSEIAIFPLHGPTLVRMPVAPVRYRKEGKTFHLAVGGGFAEVRKDRVLFVTPRFERISSAESNPLSKAKIICEKWQEEIVEFQKEMVGYL
jgi:F-type H+-transporting ATPase subunit epsilon